MLRCCFMGTPSFALPTLELLVRNNYDICSVWTQPDRPRGRSSILKASCVKLKAEELKLSVYQPENLNNKDVLHFFKELKPDVAIVVAYGLKIPDNLLDIPRYGFINIHPSLLPKYRGASPIQTSLAMGDSVTGVSIMKLISQMDAGPLYLQVKENINEEDTYGVLHNRLALLGAKSLEKVLDNFVNNKVVTLEEQDSSLASYCSKITKDFCQLNWNDSSLSIINKVRSLSPRPYAQTTWGKYSIKIINVVRCQHSYDKESNSGSIMAYHKNKGLEIKTGDGSVLVTKLKVEGRRVVSAADFMNGFGAKCIGTCFI